ncbi:MAG: TetR/AcrR family transcriptional regulator [Proteobacteria bacterium]|nr:TetR/AcrR family transcriptional regulator [Pseudomonadota bacterium]
MTSTRRERLRVATIAEIKQIARRHMAEKGTAALSFRAIAREMGMTSPALYRYFAGRDDLVTDLIVDAYHTLATALQVARDDQLEGDHAARVLQTAHAYRNWALAHPADYQLIFGTPIPGYHAPAETTGAAAAQSMMVFIDILDCASGAGELHEEEAAPELMAQLQPWIDKLGYVGSPAVVHFALAGWARIHGLVSLELFGHLCADPEEGDAEALFEAEIRAMMTRMGVGKQSTVNGQRKTW